MAVNTHPIKNRKFHTIHSIVGVNYSYQFRIEFMILFSAEYVQIHQPSLTVTSDETVRLSCEIQYGTKVDRKIPSIFWFEDIYNVR